MEFPQNNFSVEIDYRASSLLHRFLLNFNCKVEVIVPANICSIVVEVILKSGLQPIFVDINEKFNFTIDRDDIVNLLDKNLEKTYIILLNCTYGIEEDFEDFIYHIKNKYSVFVVIDKCLSIPNDFVKIQNSLADLILYSTGYAKVLEFADGGGLGFLRVRHRLKQAKFEFGRKTNFGFNNPEEYLLVIDQNINHILKSKQKINEIYDAEIGFLKLSNKHNYWRYNIIVQNPDLILQKIFAENLFASRHYIPVCKNKQRFDGAWQLYDGVINLFNDHYITEDNAFMIAKIVKKNVVV
jgi:dTDP-4-amino-4,6-dideoxygalactose transaminase